MAQSGRKPKPTAVKVLEGNPGKRSLNRQEPKPEKKDNGGKDENDKDGETAEAAPGNGNKPAMAVNGG